MKFIIHKILRHKGRYVSLILSLVIVQTLMIIIINLGISLADQFIPDKIFNVDRVYQLDIMLEQPDDLSEFSELLITTDVTEAICDIDEVDEAYLGPFPRLTGRINYRELKSLSDSVKNIFYTWAGGGFEKIIDVKLVKGKFFSENHPELKEVLITESLAKQLNLFNKPLPQTITLPGIHDSIEWQSNVCGIIKDLDYYNAQKKAEKVYPIISKVLTSGSCILKAKKGINITTLESKIKDAVQPFANGNLAAVEIVELDDTVWMSWNSMKNQVLPIVSLIPIILLYTLLALFGLFWNDIMHKKAEFGILRAIGFNRWNVFSLILKEVILLSIITIFSTLFISSGISVNMGSNTPQYLSSKEIWLISSIAITALILLAAIFPALKITRINPVEALAEE